MPEEILTPAQCRMARAALGLGVGDLAKAAAVGINTVSRFENGSDAHQGTQRLLRNALEAAGIQFVPENGGGEGVRFRQRKENR